MRSDRRPAASVTWPLEDVADQLNLAALIVHEACPDFDRPQLLGNPGRRDVTRLSVDHDVVEPDGFALPARRDDLLDGRLEAQGLEDGFG